jgi:hypothetical protein
MTDHSKSEKESGNALERHHCGRLLSTWPRTLQNLEIAENTCVNFLRDGHDAVRTAQFLPRHTSPLHRKALTKSVAPTTISLRLSLWISKTKQTSLLARTRCADRAAVRAKNEMNVQVIRRKEGSHSEDLGVSILCRASSSSSGGGTAGVHVRVFVATKTLEANRRHSSLRGEVIHDLQSRERGRRPDT